MVQNPRFYQLRFYTDRNNGQVTIVHHKRKEEIVKIDCRSAQGRKQLIEFLIEWWRTHPPPQPKPRKLKVHKKRTAAATLAERTVQSRGRGPAFPFIRSHSKLAAVTENPGSQDEAEEAESAKNKVKKMITKKMRMKRMRTRKHEGELSGSGKEGEEAMTTLNPENIEKPVETRERDNEAEKILTAAKRRRIHKKL